ncbi:D-alanine--D-alanine ligase [Candidatus Uhrbacteria bacterium]|nr:D-alanine--D-alanine ligase [Candidatus Uhrbacteria bacterium]
MRKKIRVGILFGGKSVEHEASLLSAKNVVDAMDKEKYMPVMMAIDRNGVWLVDGQRVALVPEGRGELVFVDTGKKEHVDVVFPVLHGTFGEDGTIQGALKIADVPFVGSGVLASSVGMDKDVAKRLLRDARIPIARFEVYTSSDAIQFSILAKQFGLPLFVKPANAGSSVGVHKVRTEEEFVSAIANAFQYDKKILIEECIVGREIECAVLGNEHPKASFPGEIIPSVDFYTYQAKYFDESLVELHAPAQLSQEETNLVQDLALRTYKTLCCEGLSRIDFFLNENGELLVNEINTIPGFTSASMYPLLWLKSGIAYPALIDQLIMFAFERFEKEQKLHYTPPLTSANS